MSAGELRVRSAKAADLDAVILLERAVVEAPHWGEAEYRAIAGVGVGGVRRCLLVGEMGQRLAGFAVGKVVGTDGDAVGELESVAVEGSARRVGVGRALCWAVVEWCRAEGASEVELEVRVGSAGAIGLYEALGFVAVGRRKGYYRGPAEDALLMRLELAG